MRDSNFSQVCIGFAHVFVFLMGVASIETSG